MPPLSRFRNFTLLVLAGAFAVTAVTAILARGAWYDEFYTFYLVRPGVPFPTLWSAWLRDNHPPLFYGLIWLYAHLVPSFTVAALRTFNLVVGAVAVAGILMLGRVDSRLRAVSWYYLTALAGLFATLDRIDQLRSYFLSLALTALVLPLLAMVIVRGRTHGGSLVVLGAVLALAESVHLVSSVIVAGLAGAAVLGTAWLHGRNTAARLVLVVVLSLVPLASSLALQLPTMLANTHAFWLPAGWSAARWAIENETLETLLSNRPLLLASLAGTAILFVGAVRGDRQDRESLVLIATTLGGLVLALAVLVPAHLHKPLIINRYLIAIHPVLAFALAVSASALTRRLPALAGIVIDVVILIAALLALHDNLERTLARPSWNGTASAISALVRACPTTLIHVDTGPNAPTLDLPPRDNREVLPFAYDLVAREHGFALAAPGSRTMARDCPTVFWTEHVAGQHPTATTLITALRAQGYPITDARVRRIGDGWILIVPAP